MYKIETWPVPNIISDLSAERIAQFFGWCAEWIPLIIQSTCIESIDTSSVQKPDTAILAQSWKIVTTSPDREYIIKEKREIRKKETHSL